MDTQHDLLPVTGDNPIDRVEQILSEHNWAYKRMNADELMLHVRSNSCAYRLFFSWQSQISALQFSCQYEMRIDTKNAETANAVLKIINEKLWIGHFDIPQETGTPSFRHTCLFGDMTDGESDSGAPVEDLVDLAMEQCERFLPAFHLLAQETTPDSQSLALALMDTRGHS